MGDVRIRSECTVTRRNEFGLHVQSICTCNLSIHIRLSRWIVLLQSPSPHPSPGPDPDPDPDPAPLILALLHCRLRLISPRLPPPFLPFAPMATMGVVSLSCSNTAPTNSAAVSYSHPGTAKHRRAHILCLSFSCGFITLCYRSCYIYAVGLRSLTAP